MKKATKAGIAAVIMLILTLFSCSPAPGVPEEFEGKYHWTDGYGRVDVILAKGRVYQYKWGGCMGEYLNEYGKYDYFDNRIIIAFVGHDLDPIIKGFEAPQYKEYYLIKWGQRHMLVRRESIELYCCAVAAKKDLRYFRRLNAFMTKVGEENNSLDGNVTIPPDWAEYYQKLVELKPDEEKVLGGKMPIPYIWHDYYLWLQRNCEEDKYSNLNLTDRKTPYKKK